MNGQTPLELRGPLITVINRMLRGGIQIGTSQGNGTQPFPGLTALQAQRLQQVAHEAFVKGFVVALHPALLIAVAILLFSALLCLPVARNRQQLSSEPAAKTG